MAVKKGDDVVVIAGNDKGVKGQVLEVLGDRVIVSGVRIIKKHQKAIPGVEGAGIIHKEAPIHISNVKLHEKKTEKKEGKR